MHLETLNLAYAVSGLLGGFLVGLTGVGGGSLMTPLLVLLFGIAPSTAVGTDLLYASITKISGIPVHARKGNIDWRAAGWLTAGSAPAALATVLLLDHLKAGPGFESTLKTSVGIALVITALAILWRATRQGMLSFRGMPDSVPAAAAGISIGPMHYPVIATVATGVVLGVLVTLSSIGAGAIGTVALVFLYPRFPISRIVGTDIAHAVPLTMIAGLGHLALGHVNVPLLVNLLVGSIPGIWLGSHLSSGIPERWSRPILALLLLTVSTRMIGH